MIWRTPVLYFPFKYATGNAFAVIIFQIILPCPFFLIRYRPRGRELLSHNCLPLLCLILFNLPHSLTKRNVVTRKNINDENAIEIKGEKHRYNLVDLWKTHVEPHDFSARFRAIRPRLDRRMTQRPFK